MEDWYRESPEVGEKNIWLSCRSENLGNELRQYMSTRLDLRLRELDDSYVLTCAMVDHFCLVG